MGLASLIKVAQGKNAGNVSFEDNFLKAYEEAVKRKELAERQVAPSDYIRPSSMYGCERMIFFQRVHSGSLNGEQSDVPLIEICQSGTDRHLDIQHIVELKVTGTVQEKKARVEQITEDKVLVEAIYRRAYNSLKVKLEMAEKIYSGLKKALSKRIAEVDLDRFSKDRYTRDPEDPTED